MTAATLTPVPTTATSPEARRTWWSDVWLVLVRELRPVAREPFSVVFGLVQPLVFLALFGPLLVGSAGGGLPTSDVWLWFVPSVLVMTTLFGTSTTGSNLQDEMASGSYERMLVTPLSRSSQIVGRALKEVVPLVAQGLLVVLVMLPFGLRPDPVGVVVGFVLLAVLGVGLGALSYALAIAVRQQEWMFWAVQQTFLFPLMILSGLLLPLEAGPRWMQVASAANPLRWVVDAERALFAGDLTAPVVAWGFVAAAATAVVGLAVGVRAILRASR
ncbi:ABC transporter permease [Cellulomonas wangsupingiae]|uniref:Transport permease protein n=1 Tax=Cellulomonas wangsupingiae TaxID=2968085 RepID=A0ABY5K4A4_9CELL|nr:ABC transporter permease [Cellulomonas wangsupingiae]MCC2335748.1 ABC transporter permease [Cellulomonas wangsupingiae]UUI63982.1 ABC transporter permease [Cellulomonas wangsupingiae]